MSDDDDRRHMWACIPGNPHGQGSLTLWSAGGKGRARHPASTVMHRNLAVGVLSERWAGRPPLDGPVEAVIEAMLPRPDSHYGTGRNSETVRASAPRWPAVTPDVDKIARLVLDALTIAGVVKDDRQVVTLTATKRWADDSGVAPCTIVHAWEVRGR